MTLQQVARQAMDYLDSVGVAADYSISKPAHLYNFKLDVITDDLTITIFDKPREGDLFFLMHRLERKYPTKSPAK